MKVWCSVDDAETQEVWREKPTYSEGMIGWVWHGGGVVADLLICSDGFLDAIFPKNIKPGECKQVTIKRWEMNDEGVV